MTGYCAEPGMVADRLLRSARWCEKEIAIMLKIPRAWEDVKY